MRVAIVAEPYYPIPPVNYGGTERVIHYLIKGLLEKGHQPVLLGPGDSRVACPVVPTTAKAIYFPKNSRQLAEFEKLKIATQKRTQTELKKILPKIEVIHSHGFDLRAFSDFPSVTTLHGAMSFENLKYYKERDGLFYVSISKNQQAAYPGLKYAQTVYNGLDPDDFPLITKPQNYVLFLGRLDHEKNPHLAIHLAINSGIEIKLAGKVDFQGSDYFKNEVQPYLNHPLVEYLGEVDEKTRISLLANAKCNLHPTSFREPFGLTVMEAAYCGTPTLAIARGSMPELIEQGKTGALVEDFVEGFHKLENCFGLDRQYIAERSRQLFNYRRMTDGYLRAYRRVISEFERSAGVKFRR
ncbi:glycosyltransferase family 4 protein [Candidatus Saccharibacteria bacterium]|nr:glycosyltransferase family 4 protein [Candidatus Saccharibacteria bacterium]